MKMTSLLKSLAVLLLVLPFCAQSGAQVYSDILDFNGGDGATPTFPNILSQGSDGNLYSTTLSGGTGKTGGVAFRFTPDGSQMGQQKVLFNFSFDSPQGYQPWSGLTAGTDGNFYGTTTAGGLATCAGGCGTIFKITPQGNLTTLYEFTGGADGSYPIAPPIEGNDGNFYGTAPPASAYKITASGQFTLLPPIPGYPVAPLMQASDGNFYGITYRGGKYDAGAIFKLSPSGVTTIYNIGVQYPTGYDPTAPLIEGSDGNLYGTMREGGADYYDKGIAFKLVPGVGVVILHNFGDTNYPNDGSYPTGGLVQATDGNFYGVTCCGGNVGQGYGVLYQITLDGTYSILYNFDNTSGGEGFSTLIQDTDGKLYGLAQTGGLYGSGVIFSFDMGLGPFVKLSRNSGQVGQSRGIIGQGLTGTTGVAFNGTSASFRFVSDTYLVATVPAGASTGYVTVSTPGGVLTSNVPFRVAP